METGYQSDITLNQLVFNGNIPVQHSLGDFGTAQGTDNYTVALQPALTEYKNGLPLRIIFANTNTGAATLNINNLGAVPLRTYAGVDLAAELSADDLKVGKVYVMVYVNGTLQLLNHAAGRPQQDPATGTGSSHINP